MIANPSTAHLVHYLFEWLALGVGLAIFRSIRKKKGYPGLRSPGSFAVVVGCLVGAALGNKVASWVDVPQFWSDPATDFHAWLGGQTLVGGLLGGWIGVEVGKRVSGIALRTGDDYVVPILAGIAIGRVGCFLAGLHDGTYGIPTQMPWGVDFGDGMARHPTQLYESAAALVALATWPRWSRAFAAVPGLAFRVFMLGYLLWRLGVDSFKPVPYSYWLGLSGIQWICIVGSVAIIGGLAKDEWSTRICATNTRTP